MNELTANVISDIQVWGEQALIWFESALPTFRVISIIVCAFFIWGIVYSIIRSGLHHLVSDVWYERLGGTDLPRRRARRSWNEVLNLIQNREDRKMWIAAFKGAEGIVNEGLKLKGYRGENIRERMLEAEEAGDLASLEDLKAAHAILKQVGDSEFPFTHADAVQNLRRYKKVIKELEMF